jgi:predicted nucleotidyltransferase
MGHDRVVPMTLDELRRSRPAILAAASRRGARCVRVFGSVARGVATATSDVDFLVEFGPERSLLDQVHLIADLEQLLGARVDVVAEGGLLDRDTHILAEAVVL